MSTKEAFEFAWIAEFSSAADGTPPPSIPSLSCWDSAGNLRSQDALRDELHSCRRRIADLRRNLRAEEFIEFYCQQELDRRGGSCGPRAVARRSLSAPYRSTDYSVTSKPAESAVPVEALYAEPVDSRIARGPTYANRPPSSEGLYSVPVNAKRLERVPSVPEPLYATPVNSSQPPAKRAQRHVYEEVIDVRAETAEKADATGDNSSDDESVANLMAIRESMNRLSQFCLDGEAARRKLEMQAKRLSSRFTHMSPSAPGSALKNNVLDSVPESLLSPTTPSGMDLGCRPILVSCTSCCKKIYKKINYN